jgi:hypothetical protein
MRVQAFVAQPAIEGFHERVVRGLPGPAEVQGYPVDVCPVIERPGDELRAIVHPDLCRRAATLEQLPVHDIDDLLALDLLVSMDGKALSSVGIDHCQGPEPLAVEQSVGDKVHRPDLVRPLCQGPLDPAPRHDVAPWTLRTQVQAFLTVKPAHTLVVHRPAFPS